MILALVYPLVLGLHRLETASFLRSNGTFQYLTGLPSFPDPQTLRRFLLHAPDSFWEQMHRVNDRLLQTFIHLPGRRSRLIFDLDSTVVTVFGLALRTGSAANRARRQDRFLRSAHRHAAGRRRPRGVHQSSDEPAGDPLAR